MTTKEEKCFICMKPAREEAFDIVIDEGGTHTKLQKEKTFLCLLHFREFQALRKKAKKEDF